MTLVNGGSGFCFMAPPVYQYLCGRDLRDISVSVADVPDAQVRHVLRKVYVPFRYRLYELFLLSEFLHMIFSYI